jgi:hypothetical protein
MSAITRFVLVDRIEMSTLAVPPRLVRWRSTILPNYTPLDRMVRAQPSRQHFDLPQK